MLKRHEIQVLRRAGHTWKEVAAVSGISVRTARRVAVEAAVTTVDKDAECARRQIGRPSKAEAYRHVVVAALTEDAALRSVELLHRARQAGYTGGKSALYALVQTVRPYGGTPLVRFEGLPAEFSQHDFGEVWVTFQDDTKTKVHFFASRLKYSRWVEVTLVPDERVETLVRTHIVNPCGRPTMRELGEIGQRVRPEIEQMLALQITAGTFAGHRRYPLGAMLRQEGRDVASRPLVLYTSATQHRSPQTRFEGV